MEQTLRRRIGRRGILLVLGAALAAGLLTAGPSLPAQASGGICTYGSSQGNAYTCIYVSGSGTYVSYAKASVKVMQYTRTLQVCLRAPNNTDIQCTMFDVVEPGWTLSTTWSPHTNVTPGSYTAVTIRKNNDASETEIGAVAVKVG